MTKADLIINIADKLKFPWARAELLVDVVFDCMEQSMDRGEKIEIRGFGTFQVRSYRAYKGRNPRSGQVVAVRPKRLPPSCPNIRSAKRGANPDGWAQCQWLRRARKGVEGAS
jgi:integration host factor subunit beta